MARWLDRVKQQHDEQHNTAPNRTDRYLVALPDAGEIAWRVEVMQRQIPPRGPIPILLARPELAVRINPWAVPLGHCTSCGEPMGPERQYVCTACQAAKWLTLNAVREDVTIEV